MATGWRLLSAAAQPSAPCSDTADLILLSLERSSCWVFCGRPANEINATVPNVHVNVGHKVKRSRSVCSFHMFTHKLPRPSVAHIPNESCCQTQTCSLPPSVYCCDCGAPVSHKPPAHDLFIRRPVGAGGGLFFESGWEIKILISSAGRAVVRRGEHAGCGVLLCKMCLFFNMAHPKHTEERYCSSKLEEHKQ